MKVALRRWFWRGDGLRLNRPFRNRGRQAPAGGRRRRISRILGRDMDSLLDLTGKIALVTGAGQGVGRATAMLLAQAGASVVVNDFHADRAQAVAEEIEALGGVAMARQADITNLSSVEAMASDAVARFG